MNLRVDFQLRRGDLELRVACQVEPGETVAVVGPNGAGKTTLLMAIAGLLAIDAGEVRFGGRVFDGGTAGTFVPPEDRGVGVVFQEHLLFPHLTVLENVAYGLRCQGQKRAAARQTAAEWLRRIGLTALGDQRPEALSGGQAQRVALARALAPQPQVLLLDEPLAAVDASARLDVRRDLRRHLGTFPGVRLVVAHGIEDALALADRILVLEDGAVVQSGRIEDLVSRPRSQYVADLVGINCYRGDCRAGVVELAGGRLAVASEAEGPVFVTVHPRAVSLFRERPAGSPRNVFAAPLVSVEPMLDRFRVQLGGPLPIVAEVTGAAVADLRLHAGGEVFVAMKATEIRVAPA